MDLLTISVSLLIAVVVGGILSLLLVRSATVVLDAITMGLETIYLFVHRKDCSIPPAPPQKRVRNLP